RSASTRRSACAENHEIVGAWDRGLLVPHDVEPTRPVPSDVAGPVPRRVVVVGKDALPAVAAPVGEAMYLALEREQLRSETHPPRGRREADVPGLAPVRVTVDGRDHHTARPRYPAEL